MPTYYFVECGTFSVTVKVEASSEEAAREVLENGDGKEIENTMVLTLNSWRL